MNKKDSPLMSAPAVQKKSTLEMVLDGLVKKVAIAVDLKVRDAKEGEKINEPQERYRISDKRARIEGILLGAIAEITKVIEGK
jgi:hypothetical protein